MTNLGPGPANPKRVVRAGYDACAAAYRETRSGFDELHELERLLDVLPEHPRVLEVGCGAGYPVGALLASRGAYIGVDISRRQLELARRTLPDTCLIEGDVAELEFRDDVFDAIVSLYTLFHLPRDEHADVLGRFLRWLRPGGYLFITVARTGHPGYTETDFFGVTMYWSHHEPSWYVDALEALGFSSIQEFSIPAGHGDRYDHPVLFARVP
ncbi:MAG: class I SAM-dependent methyltransferase [Rhodospirillaceae bacterium]|nr:class I SAM-dependent methyltransferase [Rhodospirillaceae bacterium]